MLYRVWSKSENEHLWNYEIFKEEVNAILVDYSMSGSIVKSILYSVSKQIEQAIFDKYNLNYRIIAGKSHEEYLAEIPKPTQTYCTYPHIKPKPKTIYPEIDNTPEKCKACLYWDDRCVNISSCQR